LFLTIVDDYGRDTWTYLLQHKSDSFGIMKILCKMVQVQFSSCMEINRYDNDLKFELDPCL